MTIEHTTNHVAEAVNNLLTQFRNKTAVEALVRAPAEQIQDLEDALVQVLEGRSVVVAVGAQLDGIGRILNVERGGRNDDAYRVALRLQIKGNNSRGTAQDLLDIIELWNGSPPVGRWQIRDAGVASFIVELRDRGAALTTSEASELALYLRAARAAGVYAYLVYPNTIEGDEQYFSFGPSADANGDSFGFGDGAFVGAVRL